MMTKQWLWLCVFTAISTGARADDDQPLTDAQAAGAMVSYAANLANACGLRTADFAARSLEPAWRTATEGAETQQVLGSTIPTGRAMAFADGATEMGAYAGQRAHDDFPSLACDKLLRDWDLQQADHAVTKNTPMPSASSVSPDPAHAQSLVIAYGRFTATLARKCGMRGSQWVGQLDSAQVYQIGAISDAQTGVPDYEKQGFLNKLIDYWNGADQAAGNIAAETFHRLGKASCPKPDSFELKGLDQIIKEVATMPSGLGDDGRAWTRQGGFTPAH